MIHRALAIIGNLLILYAVDFDPVKGVIAYLGLWIWYLGWRIFKTSELIAKTERET